MLFKPSERAVSTFITSYLQALHKLVEKTRNEILKTNIDPNFPIDFPVKSDVFFSERGFIINFEKAEKYSIHFLKERPAKWSKQGMFIFYSHFKSWKDRADKKARSDVEELLAFPALLEQHEEELQEQYEAQQIQEMEFNVDSYIDSVKKSYEVITKTRENAFNQVHDIMTIRQNFLGNFEYFRRVGCRALSNLYFLIALELETSFDLALHGRYIQAMANLRKVLEVMIRALSLDCEKDSELSEFILSNWINDGEFSEPFRFSIETVIPKNIDEKLSDIIEVKLFREKSHRTEILSLYHELCKFVHLRPKAYTWDIELIYPEYSSELFDAYWKSLGDIMLSFEALLVFSFPQIVEIEGLGSNKKKYVPIMLSNVQLQALIQLSKSLNI
jgi:hypothetical protein